MKKLLLLGIVSIIFLGLTKKQTPPSLVKVVMVEIDKSSNDSVLFTPFSKGWEELWQFSEPDLFVNGSVIMNYEKYKSSFINRATNLWTIVHPLILEGKLNVYYGYDPVSFGLGPKDDGELRYPCISKSGGTIFTDEEYLDNISILLGRYFENTVPMIDEDPDSPYFGEPLVVTDSISGMMYYVYEPADFRWFRDRDIIKFKIRVEVHYTKKGTEKKRVIKSIAPIVYEYDGMGQPTDYETELCWLDFKELKPILKKHYLFNKEDKPQSYLDYIEDNALQF